MIPTGRPSLRWAIAALLCAGAWLPASAAATDRWVLSLTWSPEACALLGQHDDHGPCVPSRGLLVHGLWPYGDAGYPADCPPRDGPPPALVERVQTVLPGEGQVDRQWQARGTCSSLSAQAYFEQLEAAAAQFQWPESFMRSRANQRISKSQLEKAFVAMNPSLTPESIAIECRSHYLTEVRLCLSDALVPQACGEQVGDVCERELIIRPQ